MMNPISLGEKKIAYSLRRSARAKHMRLSVYSDGRVTLTLPLGFPERLVAMFLHAKAQWIAKHLSHFLRTEVRHPIVNKKEYLMYKKRAQALAEERLLHFNAVYRFSWKRISIRNQRTRWGSCSKKGNLNFNYRIALLPQHLADYIIVHELCHLEVFDHSKKFWDMVARTIPVPRELRRELHAYAKCTFVS